MTNSHGSVILTISLILVKKEASDLPKSYSDQEREYIKRRLKEEAAACMAQYGIRRTTVDELVKRVNIPKGTFYLFYKSKELLLFDVILEQHELVDQKLYQAVCEIAGSEFSAEKLTDVIFKFFKMWEFPRFPVCAKRLAVRLTGLKQMIIQLILDNYIK